MFPLDKGSAPLREETRAPRAAHLTGARPTLYLTARPQGTPLCGGILEPNASKVTLRASAGDMDIHDHKTI